MEHLTLKAATAIQTDQGTFEAVISAATIDREKDIVDPAGMVRALQKWVPTGKNIPLAWQHSTRSEDQIGYIDPASARVVNDEVVANGFIDQSTPVGRDAWRLVKMGTLGFSFGYLIPDGGATKRAGGGLDIRELDVFEITATPTPMHNGTRVLGYKAEAEALRNRADQVEREYEESQLPEVKQVTEENEPAEPQEPQEPPEQAPLPDAEAQRKHAARLQREQEESRVPEVKQVADEQPEETDQPPTSEQMRILNSMIGQAQEFITSEDDAEDAAEMACVLEMLEELRGEPDTEDEGDDAMDPGMMAAGKALHRWFKAQWTTAYENSLPDSAFLHVGTGGTKDSEGKTVPRSLRMFPIRDDSGAVDLPHLRNALARIPQSNLDQATKDRLSATAQRMLDRLKAVDVTGKEPKARTVDPLREKADAVALEYASDGESLRKPPRRTPTQAPPDLVPLKELKARMREEMLTALSGGSNET